MWLVVELTLNYSFMGLTPLVSLLGVSSTNLIIMSLTFNSLVLRNGYGLALALGFLSFL